MLNVDWPSRCQGFDDAAYSLISYNIVCDGTEEVYFSGVVQYVVIKTLGDALYGGKRCRIAQEEAVKNNIGFFIDSLFGGTVNDDYYSPGCLASDFVSSVENIETTPMTSSNNSVVSGRYFEKQPPSMFVQVIEKGRFKKKEMFSGDELKEEFIRSQFKHKIDFEDYVNLSELFSGRIFCLPAIVSTLKFTGKDCRF